MIPELLIHSIVFGQSNRAVLGENEYDDERCVFVTSRKVVCPFLEHLGLDCVPVLHCLQGRPTAQG